MLQAGDPAPDFELPNQDGESVRLSSFKGQKLIVYFYPKDNTPGCTTEAKNFQATLDEYEAKGYQIIGISRDTVASHRKFADKYGLEFPLLSDRDEVAAKAFGALAGKRLLRRTWMITEDWTIERVFEKVSPSKHNAELCALCGIQLPDL